MLLLTFILNIPSTHCITQINNRGSQLKIWWKILWEWNDLIGCGHLQFILEQIFLQIKISCWTENFWNNYLWEQQKKCSSRSSLCDFLFGVAFWTATNVPSLPAFCN
jgi:hypothetical protein